MLRPISELNGLHSSSHARLDKGLLHAEAAWRLRVTMTLVKLELQPFAAEIQE